MAYQSDFYQTHLDRVSRSFAFCIRQLRSPLREWIGLSYLLCRLVDTIEDAPWSKTQAQLEAFRRFDRALLSESDLPQVSGWVFVFPSNLSDGERLLLADAERLLGDYHRLPPPVREVMCEMIHSMSLGMQHFCATRSASGGLLRLRSLSEVNQYCFFVAGLVGELLAKLVERVEPRLRVTQDLLLRAHHFGLFLQKVNLLKDQVGDEQSGRHLIPSRELVEASAETNARQALEFLLALPAEQPEFRRFCAWSLFLGLESLYVARQSIVENRVLKVSRQISQEVLAAIEVSLNDERGLRSLFQVAVQRLGWPIAVPFVAPREAPAPTWMIQLYRGPLGPAALTQLL